MESYTANRKGSIALTMTFKSIFPCLNFRIRVKIFYCYPSLLKNKSKFLKKFFKNRNVISKSIVKKVLYRKFNNKFCCHLGQLLRSRHQMSIKRRQNLPQLIQQRKTSHLDYMISFLFDV
jgi:hypothetical protein